jgi:TrmH family RNA methyltransferase
MEKITHKDNAQSTIAAFRQRALGLVDLPAPRGPALYLALWKVRDPGNLGTILRTADCAGASGVLLLEQCCDPYSFETVRASMGSLFDIPFVKCGWDEFRRWQKKERLYLAAASMHGKARHDRSDLAQPLVLLMGNEQQGLPGEQEQACDALIRIPMRGGADSLNLAQAAGILTYEAWRQRDFR